MHLAQQINGVFVPEYSREFLLARNGNYTQEDLDLIAIGQKAEWEKHSSAPFLICDTEMIVMKVWSEFKYGNSSPTIQLFADEQVFDHYFLCRPDIEWEEDPLREHPEQRDELFTWYLRELTDRGLPFTIVEGDLDQRVETCLRAIDN